MYLIQKESAVEAVYLLMGIDGNVDSEEVATFDGIGSEIGGESFETYKKDLIDKCESKLKEVADYEDRYDILAETVDLAIAHKADTVENGIPSRMLIWNSLMMSYANGSFDPSERRLIRHISRVTGIPVSVYMEMEQLMKSYAAVCGKLTLMQNSDLPYTQIRPIVDELEERKKTLTKCATELIADEIVNAPEPVIVKDDIVDKAKAAGKTTVNKMKEAVEAKWSDYKTKNASAMAEDKGKWETTKNEFLSIFKKKKRADNTDEMSENPADPANKED